MIKIFQKTVKDMRLRSLKRLRTGSWVYATDPNADELQMLIKDLGLEEGLLGDALDPFEVPRLEQKNGVVYIFNRFPVNLNNEISTAPLLIAVGSNFVATISKTEVPFLDNFITQNNKKALFDFSTTQKTKLAFLFLSLINKQFNSSLTAIRRDVRGAQVKLESISNRNIMQLVTLENALNDFLGALEPSHTILEALLNGKVLKPYEQDRDFVEDLYLSNGQLIEASKSKLRNIINVREAYSTIMTNDLNRILRFFAALTIILTIPTIVGSIYGMNIPLPFDHSPFAFLGIIAVILMVTLAIYAIFVKKRWV
jgi:magnesium transporter